MTDLELDVWDAWLRERQGTSGRNPVQYLTIGRTLQILPANRIYSGEC